MARYKRATGALIKTMRSEYQRELERASMPYAQDAGIADAMAALLKQLSDKWGGIFASRAVEIAESMISGASKYSEKSLDISLKEMSGGLTLKVPDLPAALRDKIAAMTSENVSLIKSIQNQYHSQIESAIMRSISQGGRGILDIRDEIAAIGKKEAERADFIAQDQTRKVTSVMNTERMKAVGVKQFVWIHSHGGKTPRPLHLDADGETFDMDSPPPIGDNGEPVMPGMGINCRCRMQPKITFGEYVDA